MKRTPTWIRILIVFWVALFLTSTVMAVVFVAPWGGYAFIPFAGWFAVSFLGFVWWTTESLP